jgi:HAD superfamily hydrolase (TIGR01509 family)
MTPVTGKINVECVMFDLDGTLIDSSEAYFKIIEIAFARLDLPPVSRRVILKAMEDGQINWKVVLPAEMHACMDGVVAKTRAVIDLIYPSIFREDVCLVPGADEILRRIASRGLKMGLVTTTGRRHLAEKLRPLRDAGIDQLLELVITTDDVAARKPAPDPLIECAKRLGVAVGNSVYVGDTRVDMMAGKAAGMKTVGVLTGFDDYETLKQERPDAILASVSDLLSVLVQS